MSEGTPSGSRFMQAWQGLTGRWSGTRPATPQGLPVQLGNYDYARAHPSTLASLQGIDRALVWVVVALLMWGMVMVYSASIAMPDNPRFARYAQTHFLMRHIISLVIGCAVALLAFQVPALMMLL